MQAVAAVEELDSADLDALLDLVRSPGYKLVLSRISDELARRRQELEWDHDPVETAKLRGRIEALKVALDIPNILMAEIRHTLKVNHV